MTGPVMAEIKQQYTLEACDRKTFFHKKMRERIREHIGVTGKDQALKEEILGRICSKITSVYIGSLDKIEQALGDTWAYRVAPEIFERYTPEEKEYYKRMAMLWNDCRLAIKELGNRVIDEVIDELDCVIFTKRKERKVYYERREEQEDGRNRRDR